MPPDRLPNATTREDGASTLIPRAQLSYFLPTQLSRVVPGCAQQCLATYIHQEYGCPPNGVACLCQNYSTAGFTLGELAYLCLFENCEGASPRESAVLYNICQAQADAAQPTLSVLTPPATTPASVASASTRATSAVQNTPASSTTSRTKSHATSLPAPKSTIHPASFKSSTSGPRESSTESTIAASSTTHSKGLTTAEAAGVAVAALGATALLIALIVFIIFFRRHKKAREAEESSQHKSFDFIDKPPSATTPVKPSFNQFPRAVIRNPPEDTRGIDRETLRYWQTLATQQPKQGEVSADSPSQHRINGDSRFEPAQLPGNEPNMPGPLGPPYTFSTGDSPFRTVPGQDKIVVAPRFNGLGLPPNPRSKQSYPAATNPQNSPNRPPPHIQTKPSLPYIQPPALSLDIPKSASRSISAPNPSPNAYTRSPMKSTSTRAPPPIAGPRSPSRSPWHQSSPMGFLPLAAVEEETGVNDQLAPTPLGSQSRDSSASFLNYYASAEAGIVTTPGIVESPIPIVGPAAPPRKAAASTQLRSRSDNPLHPAKRESNASDTSFESTDADEPTPPNEDEKQLTPVQESPYFQSSPIADIRYPKIPRSVNQAIPRSPPASRPKIQKHLRSEDVQHNLTPERHARSRNLDQQREWPLKSPVTPDRPAKTTPSLSGSTLAAKRRGSSAAQSLELRLEIPDTAFVPFKVSSSPFRKGEAPVVSKSHYHDSPLRGYGRQAVAGNGRNPSRGRPYVQGTGLPARPPRKSSLKPAGDWEPKLTPEKRGDDLYLQVSVATPLKARFGQ